MVSQRRCLLVYRIVFSARSYLHNPKRKMLQRHESCCPVIFLFRVVQVVLKGRGGTSEHRRTQSEKGYNCPLLVRRRKLHIARFTVSGKSSLIPVLFLSPKSLRLFGDPVIIYPYHAGTYGILQWYLQFSVWVSSIQNHC